MQQAPDRQQLRLAVQRQPADFIAWVMLADAELEAGDITAGHDAATRALQLRANHPEALARKGPVPIKVAGLRVQPSGSAATTSSRTG